MRDGPLRDRQQPDHRRRPDAAIGLKGRLDPKVERPELQQFDYDPIADAKDNRGELVAAALTILRAYHVAGRPGRLPQLQSFAEWSDMVRSAMVWLGVEDPVEDARNAAGERPDPGGPRPRGHGVANGVRQ